MTASHRDPQSRPETMFQWRWAPSPSHVKHFRVDERDDWRAPILVGQLEEDEEGRSYDVSVLSLALHLQSSISATSMWDKSIMCLCSNHSNNNSWCGQQQETDEG